MRVENWGRGLVLFGGVAWGRLGVATPGFIPLLPGVLLAEG
jgi:hypothetical protein